ncbi:MAG TPA: hypothetical protein VFV99_32600 [Kofleriaceae bacterium]|nr:hypothetical protein [Kofleriaceae bacterium]
MRRSCELVVALWCAGCAQSDYVDLTGVYRVDAELSSEPCGIDQPVAQPWPYLKFQESTTLSGFWLLRCSDRATMNCGGDMFLDAFPQPTDAGWIGELSDASNTTPCVLLYSVRSARLDGDHLTVGIEDHSEEVPDADCSPREAELRSTLMPCTKHERFGATRL